MITNVQVSTEEAQRFAQEHNLSFLETSAASGAGVDDLFVQNAGRIVDKLEEGVISSSSVQIGVHEELQTSLQNPNSMQISMGYPCCGQ